MGGAIAFFDESCAQLVPRSHTGCYKILQRGILLN